MILFVGIFVYFSDGAVPPGGIITLIICVLLWAMLQFSQSFLVFDPTGKRFRIEHRLYRIFPFGKWIAVEDVEAYYARPAKVASNVTRGRVGAMVFKTEEIQYKSWLIELKLRTERSYKPLFEVNKKKVQQIVEEVFDHTGIEFKRIVPNGTSIKKRRR